MTDGATGRVYTYLYQNILSGDLPLGSPISEVVIGQELNLSRSPVREALKRMEAEGLVNHFPGRGTFVTDITQRDLEEIFDLRIMFELRALQTAYQYIEDEVLNRLEAVMVNLDENSLPEDYYNANNSLHKVIVAYGGNKRLEKFFNMLSAQFAIVNRISSRDPEHFSHSKQKHLEILWAIKRRDLPSAEISLRQHLEEVRERTIKEYSQPLPRKGMIKINSQY